MEPSAPTTAKEPSRSRSDAPVAGPADTPRPGTPPPEALEAAGMCRIVVFEAGTTTDLTDPAELEPLVARPNARIWIDLTDPPAPLLAEIGRVLGLHPLVIDDIVERNQRAKLAIIEDDVHLVLFAIEFDGEVVAREVDFVATGRVLLSVHDAGVDLRRLPQLRMGPGPLLARGVDYFLYAVADGIVDGYFPVLDRLADDLDQLQDDVVESASSWSLQRLFVLKRELIMLRRAVSPAREILNQLTNRDLPLIRPDHIVYFRDVYDHLIRVTDELDNYRELVAGTLDVYLSTVNNNLSAIMKRLTGVTVILAGIGAVAGVFGMSEAGAAFAGGEGIGFWIVTGAVVLGAAMTALVLRRADWI